MAKARWTIPAAQMAQLHNLNRGKNGRRAKPADFNPFEARRRIVKAPIDVLRILVPGGGHA